MYDVPGAPMPMSAEDMMAAARAETGVTFVDAEIVEPLKVLIDSFNREGGARPEGALMMQSRLVRILANRLRMKRDFDAHPEIRDQKITAPIFVCGMGRTGSTKTQKLLASSGDFNWNQYWMVLNPSLRTGDRSESPQARIDDARDYCEWFNQMSPETLSGHAFFPHEPEEESMILEHSLRTPCFMGWAELPSYLTWVVQDDMRPQFVQLKETLQYLQWQGLADPSKPWLLKSPLYSGLEPLLLEAFPDARLLMTHRAPAEFIPSGIRLMDCFHKPFTDIECDPVFYTASHVAIAKAHLANRAAMPADAFCDINFLDLVKTPGKVIDRIYAFCGVPLSDETRARMLDWDANNPESKYGKHVYSLAQFGLTKDGIERDFVNYYTFLRERFG